MNGKLPTKLQGIAVRGVILFFEGHVSWGNYVAIISLLVSSGTAWIDQHKDN